MMRLLRMAGIPLACALAATPSAAAPGDLVKVRIEGYRDLGEAFKAVNDGLRKGSATPQQMQRLAARISASAQAQYGWFPAGSGPRPGVKTAARPEIWTRARGFRAAQDAFSRQARAFTQVAAIGDPVAMRTAARQLGASCKSCHDAFRVEND
jgi:cytochrome c556